MNKIFAGVDEVGRGSLIGPVYAAAVILDKSVNRIRIELVLQDNLSLKRVLCFLEFREVTILFLFY